MRLSNLLVLAALTVVELGAAAYALRAFGDHAVGIVAATGGVVGGALVAAIDPPPHEAAVLGCFLALSLDLPTIDFILRVAEDDGLLTFLLLGVVRIVSLAAGFAATHYVRFARRHG